MPQRVFFEQGYAPLWNATDVLRGLARPFFVFNREFFYPCDNLSDVSAAAERFHADARRFPAPAHEESSLLWRKSEWRVPSPEERSLVMGPPISATAAVQGPEPKCTQVRNSLLRNGFHLPSVMCLLCMLLAVSEAKPVLSHVNPKDVLASRLQHSLWAPGFLEAFPDLLDAPGVVDMRDMLQIQFEQVPVPETVWSQLHRNLSQCNLWLPQAFTAFQRGRGHRWQSLPPHPLRARDRAQIFAGNTGQRFAS